MRNTEEREINKSYVHCPHCDKKWFTTVRDNKYLESAIGVFDDRYETAGEAVEEPESKSKYYHPPKRKPIEQEVKAAETPQENPPVQDTDELTQRVAAYMEQHNITDLEEFLSAVVKKGNAQM